MTTIRAFFPKLEQFFPIFEKKAGETSPPSPSSYAPVATTVMILPRTAAINKYCYNNKINKTTAANK